MQYSVAHLAYSFAEEWQQAIFEQAMSDLGFEVFDESNAYIQTSILDEQRCMIEALISQTEGVELISWEECPDENWNAQWEADHEIVELPLGIQITPHCAFGAGHHETTSMMIQALIDASQEDYFGVPRTILDMGCGTGVLGIMAKKCGAHEVIAVDIDDKSVTNSIENALANDVQLDVRLGSTPPHGEYDLILANIHRNILISHMSQYAEFLKKNGQLWLSGFYTEDIPYLLQAAANYNIQLIDTQQKGEWCMLKLKK
jgi:ribosomal protein L11 methyltransferase